jgi:cytochrome oxidase assembly protein ShyY1
MNHYLTIGRWRMSVWVLLMALAGIVLTIDLGRWQTRRAAEKIATQEHLSAAEHGTALPIDGPSPNAEALVWHRVATRGTWIPQDVVYLDNRPTDDGRVGFYVIMPLRLESGVVVMVNRGWLPRDGQLRTRIAPYDTPTGLVDVEGVALPDESHFIDLGDATLAVNSIWENFNFEKYARASGLAPLHLVIREDNQSLDRLSRAWPDRGAVLQGEINRHYGYTFQWYAMALAIAALVIYYGFRRKRVHVQ